MKISKISKRMTNLVHSPTTWWRRRFSSNVINLLTRKKRNTFDMLYHILWSLSGSYWYPIYPSITYLHIFNYTTFWIFHSCTTCTSAITLLFPRWFKFFWVYYNPAKKPISKPQKLTKMSNAYMTFYFRHI